MSDNKPYNLKKSAFEQSTFSCLLDYLEANQCVVHYHCRDGYCGACRTNLVEGDINYITEPLAFIRKGEFLPCCSTPKSDLIIAIERVE